jgi:hypothetical protein
VYQLWTEGKAGLGDPGSGGLELQQRKLMRKKISQREANQLKKRVKQLESNLTNSYAGTRIDTWTLNDAQFARIKTANLLGYNVLLFQNFSGNEIKVVAVK